MLHGQPPQHVTGTKAKEYIDEALSTTMHTMRAGAHSTLGSSHGSLVFNRNMFRNIPLIANWHVITKKQEHLVNENLMCENKKCCRHNYAIDRRVLKKWYKSTKLGPQTSGPYRVAQTHVNGTLTKELRQGVTELINIR